MNILITGIDGFIGNHLSKALVKRGHKVKGSGSVLNKGQIEKEIKGVDCVIHLAGKTTHGDLVVNKLESLETNVDGTKNVLDAFIRSEAKKFIYPSSGKVYGKVENLPIRESHPTNPLNVLGKTKLIAEKLIDFYSNNDKEFVILRIFNVYGEGQKENFLIPTILKQLKTGKKEIVLGDIESKRDYIHIDDVVSAIISAIEGKNKKGIFIYNISTGVGCSAKDIVYLIGRIIGSSIKIKVNSKILRSDESKVEYGSYNLAKKELGWEPKISLEEGLRKLILN